MQQKAFMQYSININQLAIVNHNNRFGTNLDIIDGVILEYLQKQSTSTFAKRNFKIVDGAIFYLLCYDNIIQQLPLIKIASKDAICRRIDKLLNANVILKHIEKIPNNGTKIYFTTTEIFESFFSYDTTQKSDGDTTQKSDELTYDKNIKDKNINDNKATAGGLVSNVSGVKENLTGQKSTRAKSSGAYSEEFKEFWNLYQKPQKAIDWSKKPALMEKSFHFFNARLKEMEFSELMQNARSYLALMHEFHTVQPMGILVFLGANGRCQEDYTAKLQAQRQKQATAKGTQVTSQKQPIKTAEEIETERMQELASIEKKNIAYSRLTKEQQEHTSTFSEYLLTTFNRIHEKWIFNCIFIDSGTEKTTLEIQIFNQRNTSVIEGNIGKICRSYARCFEISVDNIVLTQK